MEFSVGTAITAVAESETRDLPGLVSSLQATLQELQSSAENLSEGTSEMLAPVKIIDNNASLKSPFTAILT